MQLSTSLGSMRITCSTLTTLYNFTPHALDVGGCPWPLLRSDAGR